jgi:ABC-2 type transport system ATP-binding protein
LLFATLQAVRRKNRAIEAPGGSETGTPLAATNSTEPDAGVVPAVTSPPASDGDDFTDTYEALTGEATTSTDEPPETIDAPEETPEWEPHPAARTTPDEDVPEITPEDADPPLAADTPSEDIWADPTPTAMSDAAALEDVTPVAGEDTASFSSFLDDDTPAAQSETPAAEDPFTTMDDEPFATQAEPAAAGTDLYSPAAIGTEEDAVPAETAIAGEDTPEEEPFERAGRWWFKRGAELLVYNEQSGEWVPSPTPLPTVEQRTPTRFGPDSGTTQTFSDIAAVDPEPQPEPEVEAEAEPEPGSEKAEPELIEPTAQQGFWRCPSCGAVNGSTSATCRMCFAARPAAGA